MNPNKDAAAIGLMKAHYKRIERQMRLKKFKRIGKAERDRQKEKPDNG